MNKLIRRFTQATIVILFLGLGVTNPSSHNYKNYAADKISTELKDNTCTQLDPKTDSSLVKSCQTLVTSIQPQIQLIIAQNTQHTNWLIFSVYQTKLHLNSLIPGYCFKTVGIFNFFLTYQIEEI